ncbi:MAG TPA: DUF2171 domain-containing protein [Gaiellaceae bacterium]|nr:DUF2171 domain-containing protein [Gaiellaceae bacterium]
MAEPVAWTVIEKGWRVVDAAGEEIGRVDEVTGDENVDIFDGITISQGILSKPKYVASENVGEILDGEVHLTLTHAQVEALQDYTEPQPQEEILPDKAKWWQRLAWWTIKPDR